LEVAASFRPDDCDIINRHAVQEVSDIVNPKSSKNKGGRPVTTGTGHLVALRLHDDLLSAVDKHMEATGAESRPETIRQILTEFLKRRGLLKS